MKTIKSMNATRGRRQTLNKSVLFVLIWLIDIEIIQSPFAFASDVPWNNVNLQHGVNVNGQLRWTKHIDCGAKTLCTPCCPSYHHYLSSLRCGGIEKEFNGDDKASKVSIEKIKEGDEKEQGSSFRPKLWGSVKSAFEMNMEAKDELIHNTANMDDTKLICPLDKENSGSNQGPLDSSEDGPGRTSILRKNAVGEDFEDESEIYDSSEEEDENNANEGTSSTLAKEEAELVIDVSSDEETTDEFEEPESGIDSEIIQEKKNVEDSTLSGEEISYDEQELEFNLVEEETKEEAAYIDSFLNELSEEEVPQSFEDIVREEWSMIPDTEGEDEGDENTIEQMKQNKRRTAQAKDSQQIAHQDAIKAREEEKRKKREARREKKKKEKRAKRAERREKEAKERLKAKEREALKRDQVLTDSPSEMNHKEEEENPKQPENVASEIETHASPVIETPPENRESVYISSGLWITIDKLSSFGLSASHEELRLSKKLRHIRKTAAHITGLHGVLSGKGKGRLLDESQGQYKELDEEDLGRVRARIAAIQAARRRVAETTAMGKESVANVPRWRQPIANIINRRKQAEAVNAVHHADLGDKTDTDPASIDNRKIRATSNALRQQSDNDSTMPQIESIMSDKDRESVKEIDLLIQEGQRKIQKLQIQKDALQRRPNPLYNYTSAEGTGDEGEDASPSAAISRTFNFPADDLVEEYIGELITTGRLDMMNHTELWKKGPANYDDEDIGDDLLTPSGDARKLYEQNGKGRRNGNNIGGGSWLLRQTLGAGESLGEKIGDAIENAAYRGVCSAIMGILAQSIAALHGVNVMKHSDIRLFVESAPDLPPVAKEMFSKDDYAREAIGKAIRKGSKKKRRRRQKQSPYHYGSDDAAFIQRDAVVETLISHCQISAPLLKLFPHAWQRALLGNIITLLAAVVSDFCEGVQFQILGHQLAFSFKPITEADMIQHIGVGGFRFNHRRARPEEFEAAVRATAEDISGGLAFLDRWHQRALGGDLLRAQIGNLIARVVLTLVDEVLHSARMDLWSAQVGGPRIVAGLEYRIEDDETEPF